MVTLSESKDGNVVQYFGVEVHRDKVYIFMEFCEGGSLSGLLAHGRIEDEMVIQVYTLQMLEGLAYLHQSGVVHRGPNGPELCSRYCASECTTSMLCSQKLCLSYMP